MIRARWHDWLASVEDGWHLLSGCCDRIFVVGLSMGGILSLLFSARYPVAGVAALAAPHHLPNDPRLRFIKLISLFKPFFAKGEPEWFDQEALAEHISYDSDPTRSYAEVRDLIKEMQATLPAVRAPTLLVFSKNDPTVLAEDGHMQAIYDALGSEKKERLWIEGSGHVITRDAQRQRVFQAVADFIERQNGQ
jgi:carboxylesterase